MSTKELEYNQGKIYMETIRLKSSKDNLEIAVNIKRPKGRPIAVLQLVHGMCGCKERFAELMQFMADNGIVCIAADNRGHGESIKDIKDLGYFYSGGYKALVDDLRMVTEWGQNEFPATPYYLLGHSMGSLAARIYIKQDDSKLSGLILCGSPSWNPLSVIGRILTGLMCQVGLGRTRPEFLQNITSDTYNRKFKEEGQQAWTCSDPMVRKAFLDNPLCNFKFTMNGANNLMKMLGQTYSLKGWKSSQPDMEILFLSGADDPCMISRKKFRKSVHSMVKVGYKNITSIIYPGMRHEVLNERDKMEVWKDILLFIKK